MQILRKFKMQKCIWTTYVCYSIAEKSNENVVKSPNDGSECRNVVYQFGGCSHQCAIKKDVEHAIKDLCTLQNRNDESVGEQLQRLFKKIETMEKEIDGKFEKMEASENITARQLEKIAASEKRIEDMLDKIGQRMASGNVSCPAGYEYYQQDQFCFKLHKACKSWPDARMACRQEGGDLISLKDSNFEIFSEIARLNADGCSTSFVWVGATDLGSEGTWFWLNGEKINSVFWWPGEPNGGTDQNCAHLNRYRNKLNDHTCSDTSNFLCQKNLRS